MSCTGQQHEPEPAAELTSRAADERDGSVLPQGTQEGTKIYVSLLSTDVKAHALCVHAYAHMYSTTPYVHSHAQLTGSSDQDCVHILQTLKEQSHLWAGGDIRMGDYYLLVDADTRVPSDCLLDGVSEMHEDAALAIMQYTTAPFLVQQSGRHSWTFQSLCCIMLRCRVSVNCHRQSVQIYTAS